MFKFEVVDNIPEDIHSDHVFFHPALIEAWLKTYRPLRDIQPVFVHAVTDSNEAWLPLVLWRRNWKNAFMRVIVPIGHSDYDYHDPIFRNTPMPEEIEVFWQGLIPFLQSKYSVDEISIEGITDRMALGEGWSRGEICPLLKLEDINSDDELMKFFTTSLRGDLRRQMRRLSEHGELTMREYNSWEEIPTATFSEFMRQHSLRWPNAYKAPYFHENLLRNGLKAGVVHFSVLIVGETEVAWHLGFEYERRYYYYMPAGHLEWMKYSPTKVHLYHLVRRAVERGYEVYDHLRGEENYKSGWSNDAQYVNTIKARSHKMSTEMKHKFLGIRRLITPPEITRYYTATYAA